MLKAAALALLLAGCTDLGETAIDAVGISWTWAWQVRAACADGTAEVLEDGASCTSDRDALEERLERELAPVSYPADTCGGQVLRLELALDPDGPC